MTREDIIRMAREAGLAYGSDEKPLGSVTRFAALVAAAEREKCASICDQRKIITPEWQMDLHYNQAVNHCAQAIRLRGRI